MNLNTQPTAGRDRESLEQMLQTLDSFEKFPLPIMIFFWGGASEILEFRH
jgi:hypothetical protein